MVRVGCKCMEFVATGWFTRKWLRLIQSLTSANLGIPLVVIQLVLTGLKNTRVVYLLDLFREEGRRGSVVLCVCVCVCVCVCGVCVCVCVCVECF